MSDAPKICANKAPNGGKGRPRGARNRVTHDVKAAIAQIAEHNVADFESWLRAIKDPARRCEVFLKVLSFSLPRGDGTKPLDIFIRRFDIPGKELPGERDPA